MNDQRNYPYNKINQYKGQFLKTGISFGSVLAIVISFNIYKSVWWAILHGILSWIYVFYYLIFK